MRSIVRRTLGGCVLVALLPAMASTVTTALPPGLARAARDWDAAQVAGDRASMERLLARDYLLVNSQDVVEDKARMIADSTDPTFHLNPFTVEKPVNRVWSGGAVLGGEATLTGTSAGKPFRARLRFSDVWVLNADGWQLVYTHANKVGR